ncbi:MAG: AbrB/MazE/SpoVT family DNA-binding domain-containing protein [Bifidobacteriaceae bacterium]|jgi:AbrB family looped-hinge helix DNA binding protein|nr:AbrB/MazE/SpoVT family DNA-binding domain-containing protein [Bifidobacteriaceae bacterium]
MALGTVTSKGQVTIPVEIRQAEGLEAGTKVEFFRLPGRGVGMVPRRRSLTELYGSLPRTARSLALDEMDQASGEELAADDERIARQGLAPAMAAAPQEARLALPTAGEAAS